MPYKVPNELGGCDIFESKEEYEAFITSGATSTFFAPDSEQQRLAMQIAREQNFRLHAQHLRIPRWSFLAEEACDDPCVVFRASMPGLTEQLASDGAIESGEEAFVKRIEQVQQAGIDLMRQALGQRWMFKHYKDYETPHFKFKLYVSDAFVVEDGQELVMRGVHAYFVDPAQTYLDPDTHDFYDFSLTLGWTDLEETAAEAHLRFDEVDVENDEVLKMLDDIMTQLCDALRG